MCNLDLYEAGKTAGTYKMPVLEAADVPVPAKLIPFHVAVRLNRAPAGCGVHFFLDDYQFERVWNAPERYVETLRRFDCVFTPDFSLYLDMPPAMKIWNIYRARTIGQFWQSAGVRVVPALSWAEPESFDYCFDGLPQGATLAVARIGADADPFCRYVWDAGFAEALRRLRPEKIFFYGNKHVLPQTDAEIFFFENDRINRLRRCFRLDLASLSSDTSEHHGK